MTTYTAGQAGSSWAVWANGTDRIAFATEAEAHIIAFALNAVADGKQLAVAVVEPELNAGPYRAVDLYDGPTEGVAPHG